MPGTGTALEVHVRDMNKVNYFFQLHYVKVFEVLKITRAIPSS